MKRHRWWVILVWYEYFECRGDSSRWLQYINSILFIYDSQDYFHSVNEYAYREHNGLGADSKSKGSGSQWIQVSTVDTWCRSCRRWRAMCIARTEIFWRRETIRSSRNGKRRNGYHRCDSRTQICKDDVINNSLLLISILFVNFAKLKLLQYTLLVAFGVYSQYSHRPVISINSTKDKEFQCDYRSLQLDNAQWCDHKVIFNFPSIPLFISVYPSCDCLRLVFFRTKATPTKRNSNNRADVVASFSCTFTCTS